MNRSAYRLGVLAACLFMSMALLGCGPSNPDQQSFRLTGYWAGCEGEEMVTGATGTVSELAANQCFMVEFTNNIEGTADGSTNLALGNIVLEKVQAVYRLRDNGKYLPSMTSLASIEVDADGGQVRFGMLVLGPEQVTALWSNEAALPPFPFDIDISYTGFGRYAGSEYRATGDFTITITGF